MRPFTAIGRVHFRMFSQLSSPPSHGTEPLSPSSATGCVVAHDPHDRVGLAVGVGTIGAVVVAFAMLAHQATLGVGGLPVGT